MGQRRERGPTMADIARHVGVSRPLVSIVLRGAGGASEATRRRVLDAAAELGYRPDAFAQGLRSHRTRNLGVLFALRRPFEVELVEHLFRETERLGYHLLLGALTASREPESVVDELMGYRCEGLIVIGPHAAVVDQVPIVEIGRGTTASGADVVRNDDALGVRQAVAHLVDLGHRAIAFADGGDNPGAAERLAGYRDAMAGHGLGGEALVVGGGYAEEDGSSAARTLLAAPLPTAVIAGNDLAAIGLLDTLLRAGVSIPGDVSVVGYDDSRFARLPGIDLTSVRQDAPRMAQLAARAVVDRLDGRPRGPRDMALPPKLVVRGTTAPPSR